MTRPRYRYEADELFREADLYDENGDETGEKGALTVTGYMIIDERLGAFHALAFTEDRDSAELIVGALNMADAV